MLDGQGNHASDEELLRACREGDTESFALLWERHRRPGLVAARNLAPSLDPDDLVSDAYLKIFELVREGRGPRGAFRPYLYQVIRSISVDRLRSPEQATADLEEIPDLHETGPWEDNSFDLNAVSEAFSTLSPRWQAALWYTEVEGMPPREAAALLGLSANSASVLAGRAREALKSAWVEAHVNRELAAAACQSTLERLQRYQRGKLTARASREVAAHLETCASCRQAASEYSALNHRLGLVLATLFVGGGAALLLGGATAGATGAPVAAAAAAAPGTSGTGANVGRPNSQAGNTGTGAGTGAEATGSVGSAGGGPAGAAAAGGASIGTAVAAVTAVAVAAAAISVGIAVAITAGGDPPVAAGPPDSSHVESDEGATEPGKHAEPTPADSAASPVITPADPIIPGPRTDFVDPPVVGDAPAVAPVGPPVTPAGPPPDPNPGPPPGETGEDPDILTGYICYFPGSMLIGTANEYGVIRLRGTAPGGSPVELMNPMYDPAHEGEPGNGFHNGVFDDGRGNTFDFGFFTGTDPAPAQDWFGQDPESLPAWTSAFPGLTPDDVVLEMRLVTPDGRYSPWTAVDTSVTC